MRSAVNNWGGGPGGRWGDRDQGRPAERLEVPGRPRGELAASDENQDKVFDWRLMKRIFAFVWPYKKRFITAAVAIFLHEIFQKTQPALHGIAINYIVAGNEGALLIIGAIYVPIVFLSWMTQFTQNYLLSWVGQYTVYDLAGAMFRRIIRLSLGFFDRNETGRIMSRVQSDVQVLQQFFSSQGILGTFGAIIGLGVIFVTMFGLNWKLTLLTMAVIPVFLIILTVWQSYARRAFRAARATISVVNASLQENVSGVRVIQSLGREDQNYRRFEEQNAANLGANLGAGRVAAATQPMVEIVHSVALALVIFAGGSMVIDGSLEIGFLYAFIVYINLFFQPIRELVQDYNQFQRATVASERVVEVLDLPIEIDDKPGALELLPIEGRITYDHVRFSYVEGMEVLPDFSLDIRAGERVALVGQTGAGKSTIVNLLLRFYELGGGRILIDGYDIRDVTQESLRRQIGVVLQDSILFTGSVTENIRYGRPDAADSEVRAAAGAVGVDELVRHLSDGYATLVHERGIGLSIGQRQLIAFARALLADPRILILDEATANLDSATELVVQNGIRELTKGRTSLIIAHRLSTIRDADRIIVLEHGRIVEDGNHDELISQRGAYYRLYSLGFQQTATLVPGEDQVGMRAEPSTAGQPQSSGAASD